MGKFEIFLGSDSRYYFRLKAKNGEIICQSEAYHTKAACRKGIKSVRVNAVLAKIYDFA